MQKTRRALVVAGLVGGLADRGMALGMSADAHAPSFDGEVRRDPPSLDAAADDFGHLLHRRPAAVVLAGSADDVATALRWAARQGCTVAARGRGHSVYGRAQAPRGVVIDMARLRAVGEVAPDRVTVEGGASWREVLAATLPRGLAPPVLTDYLDLSVGGTLAVGGIGAATARSGLQSDHVLALEVVTGDGRRLRCSARHHADVFDAVRAGLGQVALVTRATLALAAAPSRVRRFALVYRDLGTMIGDQRRLAAEGRFDAVQGAIAVAPSGRWTFKLDAVKSFETDAPDDDALLDGLADERARATASTLPYPSYLDRLSALERALRSSGQWGYPHPWLTTFVGNSRVEEVVGGELASLTPADLGPFGQVSLSAFPRSAVRTPLSRLPADPLCHAFNLIRFPATAGATEAAAGMAANRAVYERVRAAGGTLYPVSAFPMSRDDWRRHFGPHYESLREAKRRFDPRGLLTPGYDLFDAGSDAAASSPRGQQA